MKKVTLEVCISSVADALAAVNAGADRLELNVGLELGGLTPSIGLLLEVLEVVKGKKVSVVTMIRPRGSGFVYNDSEKQVMVNDAESLLYAGADGIVFGGLNEQGALDEPLTHTMCDIAKEHEAVFHRAFDVIEDQEKALADLIELGVKRVLTSGGKQSAEAGIAQLKRLRELSRGRIEILAGAGIGAENVERIVRETGCDGVHGSFSVLKHDEAGVVVDNNYPATCETKVRAVREILDKVNG